VTLAPAAYPRNRSAAALTQRCGASNARVSGAVLCRDAQNYALSLGVRHVSFDLPGLYEQRPMPAAKVPPL